MCFPLPAFSQLRPYKTKRVGHECPTHTSPRRARSPVRLLGSAQSLRAGFAPHTTYATVLSFPGRKWYGGQGPLTDTSQFFSCLTALLVRF